MACFVAPVAEAAIASVAVLILRKKEQAKAAAPSLKENAVETTDKVGFSRKLGWLCKLLWGGSLLLAFEHVWHGEVVPWFPFLTAMSDPDRTAEMLHEIATTGVCMALLITAVWGGMLLVSHLMEKRARQGNVTAKEGADA